MGVMVPLTTSHMTGLFVLHCMEMKVEHGHVADYGQD